MLFATLGAKDIMGWTTILRPILENMKHEGSGMDVEMQSVVYQIVEARIFAA